MINPNTSSAQPPHSRYIVRIYPVCLRRGEALMITGAADDDPSGISTYSVTGASFGYAPLWTSLFSLPSLL
ncbi:MAG TPA: hypothetical protein VFU37_11040 [Pyrinomonadaceae bacterium]|nr:hypothetical protein [Pyrinomonadaceae bacterium]